MHRDDDFALVRPEGTWALSDWRVKGADNRYATAVDAVVEVLRELGALDYDTLCSETVRRYPVTIWRVSQCLSNSVIGRTADGRYDLAERGATPIEDSEPKRPKSMEVHGSVVGVQLDVNHDLLRGSGLGVNRWLTWYLGLRTAPSTRYFAIDDGQSTLTVKRGTSTSQISSLRAVAQRMKLHEGCQLVVLLHLDTETATFEHVCQPETCPALRSVHPPDVSVE